MLEVVLPSVQVQTPSGEQVPLYAGSVAARSLSYRSVMNGPEYLVSTAMEATDEDHHRFIESGPRNGRDADSYCSPMNLE